MKSFRKLSSRDKRSARVRRQLKSVANGRPRLSVFRSGRHIYAQLIDDTAGHTIAAASSVEGSKGKASVGATVAAAEEVGKRLAERAREKGVDKVVFDRGGYIFHGRVKALAEAARAGGLDF
jgi:large subunit ribosomal protein L18